MKYGFAILGTGLISRFHARAVLDAPGAELIGVCSRSQQRADDFAAEFNCAAFTSLDAMLALNSVDVLLITTPSGAHLEPATTAARAGKHVLCEKPLEITVERAERMMAAHAQAGTQLGCIFQMRHFPALQPIREALDEARFGTVTHAAVYVPWWRAPEYYTESEWHGTKTLDGGGALMNQSIHMIDLLCSLMPPVKSVAAVLSSAGHPGIEVEDCASASIIFEGGALGTVIGTTSSWPGRSKRLEITGTEGTVVMEDENIVCFDFKYKRSSDVDVLETFSASATLAGVADPGAMTHDGHTACINDFVDALHNRCTYAVDGDEALKSIGLIEAIYRSAASGSRIDL